VTLRARRRPKFFRFSELTRENVNRDFQVHTSWTDGANTTFEVLEQARQVGLTEIAFTEHARARSDYYVGFFQEVEAHADRFPEITVYRGFEVKVLDESGTLDMSPAMKKTADLILGSVHSFPDRDGKPAPPAMKLGEEKASDIEFGLARGIIEGGFADVLSHAGGMCLRAFGRFPEARLDKLVSLAAEHGVAFEINISYHAAILDQLIQLLARHDPLVSIGSDAHRLEDIGACRNAVHGALAL